MIMFSGGVRCGKSALAQAWAEKAAPVQLYLATCRPGDAEMRERISVHKAQRGKSWLCIEESINPLAAIYNFMNEHPDFNGALLLDSLDMLLNNLLCEDLSGKDVLKNMEELLRGLASLGLPCAIVSAECGRGFVPLSPLARLYGDLLGVINQKAAAMCSSVIQVFDGLPLVLKGSLI